MEIRIGNKDLNKTKSVFDLYENTRKDIISLAMLASIARRIEPELLRSLRLSLGDYFLQAERPTVATEAALWFSYFVESRGSDSITLYHEYNNVLQKKLKDNTYLLQRAYAIIEDYHKNLSPIIQWEEKLTYLSLIGGNIEEINKNILSAIKIVQSTQKPGLEQWIIEMLPRVPDSLRQNSLFIYLQTVLRKKQILDPNRAKIDLPNTLYILLGVQHDEGNLKIGHIHENIEYAIKTPNKEPIIIEISTSNSTNQIWKPYVIHDSKYIEISLRLSPIWVRTSDDAIYLLDPPGFEISPLSSRISVDTLLEENKRTRGRFLDIGNCGLAYIPGELFSFDWLEELNLGDYYWSTTDNLCVSSKNNGKANKINTISLSNLNQLSSLKVLHLSSNEIADIRPLEKITQLESLDLSNNQIRVFSESNLIAFPILNNLYLYGNPIENIPQEIFNQEGINKLNDILDYFNSLKKAIVINNEVKLIILGNTTVGKTSLIQFLQQGVYEKTQNSTHGTSLQHWQVNYTQPPLNVSIWDFGGQEYYHATHRLFMDDRAVYLVAWEVATNQQGVQETVVYTSDQRYTLPLEHFPYSYWLESIRYYAPQSTILMIQTKTDKTGNAPQVVDKPYFDPPYNVQFPTYQLSIQNAYHNKDDNTKSAWQEFKAFETKLLYILQNDAAKYPIGAKWAEIRDAIRQMAGKVQWLSLSDFETFCRQIDPTIELNVLMAYLGGSASTILHYEHDPKLNNIVFLNPQWVSHIIYDILSYDIQKKYRGEFTRGYVEQVLIEKGTNSTMTDTFLELMKAHRLELIFEKPNAVDTYIAPQYLPEQYDTDALAFFRPASSLQFTLYFPQFMPRSIFLRFMVRYGKQAKYIYWKHGFILYKGEVRIVAECFFSDRKISVSIDDKSLATAKQLSHELFGVLWELSDKKTNITVSVNGENFVEIGQLERCLLHSRNTEIESIEGKWLLVSELSYLFGKHSPEPVIPVYKLVPQKNSPEIFFSYAWGKVYEEQEEIINELYESLQAGGYTVIRNQMDLGHKGLISDFMKRIGWGSIVVVALSDKYLKSTYCMFELYEAFRNSKLERGGFIRRIFSILTETLDLSPRGRNVYRDYWKSQQTEWTEYVRKYPEEISSAEYEEYERIKEIVANLGMLFEILADMNTLSVQILSQNDFAEIKKAINERIQEFGS